MNKQTLVSSNFECNVIDVKGEPHLELTIKGISHKNYASSKVSFANQSELKLYIPLWAIPYRMRKEREAVGAWEIRQLDFLKRIKDSYNTEVK